MNRFSTFLYASNDKMVNFLYGIKTSEEGDKGFKGHTGCKGCEEAGEPSEKIAEVE